MRYPCPSPPPPSYPTNRHILPPSSALFLSPPPLTHMHATISKPIFPGLASSLTPPAFGSTLAPTLTLMTGTDSIRILEFLVQPRSSVPTERERREMMWSRSQRVFYGRRPRSALSFCPVPIPSCLSLSSTSPPRPPMWCTAAPEVLALFRSTFAFTVVIRYRPADILELLPPWAHHYHARSSSSRAHNAPPMPDLITSEPTPAFFSQQSPSSSSGSLHLSPITPRPTFSVLDRARSRSS